MKTPNAIYKRYCRQTLSAKIQSQKGKSPNRTLRSLNNFLVGKMVYMQIQPAGRLGSSQPLKKA